MRELQKLLERLVAAEFQFVLVGGFAATVHGVTRISEDLDVCASFSEENLGKLLSALTHLSARFRDKPGMPLPDAATLSGYRTLYLQTAWGDLDILGEIAGVGRFDAVDSRSVEIDLSGCRLRVLSLDALIDAKRSLARVKDREALRELETIRAKLKGS